MAREQISRLEMEPGDNSVAARFATDAVDDRTPDYRVYSGIPGMVTVADADGCLVAVSDHWLQQMGYTREEVLGTRRTQYFSPQWLAYLRARVIPEVDARGTVDGVELELIRKDGTYLPVLVSSRADSDPVTGRRLYVTVSIDISEHKAAERELRQSEARFRALFECASDLNLVIDLSGIVRLASPSTLDVMGYAPAELIGKSLFDYIHPDEAIPSREKLDLLSVHPGAIERGEMRARASDGSWRSIAWSARNAINVPGIDGILITGQDMTEFRRLEAQLNDARRLQSIGTLAGGIAHDINNILGAVLGFAKFLHEDLDRDSPQHTYADRIVSASERGRDLIHQIFAFSRAGRVERQPEDVVALTEETIKTLPALMPIEAKLSVRVEHKPLIARVNAAQIQQLLLNLAVNARDALGGKTGAITIDVGEISLESNDYRELRFHEGNGVHPKGAGHEIVLGSLESAARYVRITVTDTGIGMGPEVLANAFEPFFTTKSRSSGTGLGLATVRNIVAATGGSCIMQSATNRGTTISVWLPLIHAEPQSVSVPPPAVARKEGQGRIIVVDDERDLADATAIGLRRLGYQAVAFNDPVEALRCFTDDPDQWRAVISDHRMPGMTGLQLLTSMKEIRPSIDFILCSGFTDGTIEHVAFEQGASHFFLKPVDLANLATAIETSPR
ncbi:MAG TPA: PAS domain S-box protein [Magnetospirillaceae bacterium]|jgi:PAS domain S-box-containing protein